MDNLQLRYECLDARDDFSAKRESGVAPNISLPYLFDDNTLKELDDDAFYEGNMTKEEYDLHSEFLANRYKETSGKTERMLQHHLRLLPQTYALCRLDPDGAIPFWALIGDDFISLTRTRQELSIACLQSNVPEGIQAERDWRCLKIDGLFAFSQAGVHASLAIPLAQAAISILAIATYNTDHILVKEADLERALQTLEAAGHTIQR